MRQLLTAAFVALTCTLVQPAMAQNEGPGVPIEKAPYHLPVFTNEYVTLLNVYIPPQRNTGYHTHSRDSVSVNVEDADQTNQDLGQPQAGPAQRSQRGRATFTAYSKQAPRTHKASNVGKTPFHNVSIIFRSSQPGHFTPSSQPERGMSLKLGEFYWQEPVVTRTVRNSGTTRVEFVEFELK